MEARATLLASLLELLELQVLELLELLLELLQLDVLELFELLLEVLLGVIRLLLQLVDRPFAMSAPAWTNTAWSGLQHPPCRSTVCPWSQLLPGP